MSLNDSNPAVPFRPHLMPELIRPECLPDLFEGTVDRHPAGAALAFGSETLTYGELEARANRLAHLLRARGAGRGHFIGIYLPRGIEAFVAILGVLKAGAAYVPLDPEYPAERVDAILRDAGARQLVTTSGLAARLGEGPWMPLSLDREAPALAAQRADRLPRPDLGPEDPAYAIFTSGSTGRPKGVGVSHRSVCHLVRAEAHLFSVRPEDRVFQGFSLAFDASVEEVWLAFFSGASLVVGSAEEVRSGPALPASLRRRGVTVLSTVPTLLATFEEELPEVRLLIVGGEACPSDLVSRWARGRRMVNTYGPTEATVIATWGDLLPGRPVTIGRAVPNYHLHVVDELLREVPPGEPGELVVAGVGVAMGYLGRPDLTAERFVPNPFPDGPGAERLYRTGDLVSWTPEGELAFHGRIDDQVKLRGFRVELGEIEAALREQPGVLTAAAAVHRGEGPDLLAGHVVLRPGTELDEPGLRAALRKHLPPYMVPARIVSVEALPTLPSGKVDRKRLQAPPDRPSMAAAEGEAAGTVREKRLAEAWAKLFHRDQVFLDEDFFVDLGGHSLMAAVMVSGLRREPGFAGLAVPDVYAFPTLRALAAELDARETLAPTGSGVPLEAVAPVGRVGRMAAKAGQMLGLYPILGFAGMQWLAPYLTYSWMMDQDFARGTALLTALLVLLGLYPCLYLLSIVVKWVVLGRIRPGTHPVWGLYHLRWWFVSRVVGATPTSYLVGTPWMRVYLRLMGARVGKNVHLSTDCMLAFDLLEIGEDSAIGVDARLEGCSLEGGALHVGPIAIGSRCRVGARAVLAPGSRMEDGAVLGDLSLLEAGQRIPVGQHWVGSPARPAPVDPERVTREASRPSMFRVALMAALYALGAFLVPVIFLTAILPGMLLLTELYLRTPGYFAYLWAVPIAALSYVVLLTLEIVVLKWAVLGRVRAGTYELHSGYVFRKWFVDQFMEVSLDLLAPLYATLYLNPWYRLLGAKLGRRAEVSTAGAASPDLLDIGEEAFIADAVSLGTPTYDLGRVTLAPTRVGRRAFVGNSAAVPGGTDLGDASLVGVLSRPPLAREDQRKVDASWLGSPAIFLPRRAHAAGFKEEETFRPSHRLVALRLLIEGLRILTPPMAYAFLTCNLLTAMTELDDALGMALAVALFPVLYFLGGVLACGFTIGLKWVLMGRYRPQERPLWCAFVWRTELVTAVHESLASSWILRLLLGTPLVPLFFRAMGARIGKDVVMESAWLTEYDLITLGDDVLLGADCTLQTHLFEDRVMKMSTVELGKGCSVGTDAVVLYDTRMEAGAQLGDLSLLMKGESLPAGTRWVGSPARPAP